MKLRRTTSLLLLGISLLKTKKMDTLAQSKKEKPIYSPFRLFKRGVHFLYFKFFIPHSADEDKKRREFILNILLVSSIFLFTLLNILIFTDRIQMGSHYNG